MPVLHAKPQAPSDDKRWKIVETDRLEEPMLNRVEAVIRCYDPCLSCSTHALGQMALRIQLLGPDGAVLSDLAR